MAYYKPDVFNSFKRIIVDKHPYISETDITRKASLGNDLGLDSLDKLELLFEFSKQHNLDIRNTAKFESASTLGDICDMLYNQLNPSTQVQTKQQVFEILNDHLKKDLGITNATPKTQVKKDLKLTDVERLELFFWAEQEFDIDLPELPYKNLDVFCERILRRVKRRKFTKFPNKKDTKSLLEKIQTKKFVNRIFNKFVDKEKI